MSKKVPKPIVKSSTRKPNSSKELKVLWEKTQKLPAGLRELILYRIPLEKLALLCRVGQADFCWRLSFWKGKLLHDGYFLPPDYDLWIRSQCQNYHSAPHFYESFSLGQVFEVDRYQKGRRKIQNFVSSCYEIKRKLIKQLPVGSKRDGWIEIQRNIENETKEIWYNWWQLNNIFLDLFFQRNTINLRGESYFLVVNFPYARRFENPTDYETLLFLLRENNDTNLGEQIDSMRLTKPFLFEDWEKKEVVFNHLLRLHNLLKTGDLIYSSTIFFVMKDQSDSLQLFKMIYFGGEIFFPPEALHFVINQKFFYKENLHRYREVGHSDRMFTLIKGFTFLTEQDQLILYYFANGSKQRSKTFDNGEMIIYSLSIGVKDPIEPRDYQKKLQDWNLVIPELNEGRWIELVQNNTESEEEEETRRSDED
jgi:hypothetical protein